MLASRSYGERHQGMSTEGTLSSSLASVCPWQWYPFSSCGAPMLVGGHGGMWPVSGGPGASCWCREWTLLPGVQVRSL